ncbi:bifunctional ADP-dependent NAD(P)H-hydrate dehydratase/NAD(P)H-hydrate epimerase [Salsuginibacillus kocurii]|uniref:bifunctional ADP-dependent NAD(P)H-hydrate dehydratase/NAD(P)H-hydrate epimerase n=1 Tax=Salsuginibacillus kocurii TaxID=427078 RepID=UPI0003612771|nr:bifunctional ADP-dependent NAD(P)H-hydrate dehydratase/NAD(P)H-hydrate epimerase [Salsuginibacillus kocurii]
MRVVTGEEMGRVDAFAMEEIGLRGELLMETAGQKLTEAIKETGLKKESQVVILAGTGNNGGDGIVISRLLKEEGYNVTTYVIPPFEKVRGDARKHLEIHQQAGHSVHQYDASPAECIDQLQTSDCVIDALLGTGIQGEVREPYTRLIEEVNRSAAFIVSIDVPSGLSAAEAANPNVAVRADLTLTVQCPKLSFYTYPARTFCGELKTLDIGIPARALQTEGEARFTWDEKDFLTSFPERKTEAHKGQHGKGCLIAGSYSMPGAAVLAGKGAINGGTGLLTMIAPPSIREIVATPLPVAMVDAPSGNEAYLTAESLEQTGVDSFDAVAVGPGLGRKGEETETLMGRLLERVQGPLIVDADGLFAISSKLNQLKSRQAPTVLTPHPGEMAQLLNCSIEEVESHRFSRSREFAVEYGVHLVLKGPFTIVTTPEGRQYVNTSGNSGLAKGGSGDVLTGLLLAFSMTHARLQEAVSNAVFLHGKTAEYLAESVPLIGINPDQLAETTPHAFQSLI